ncbi:MAG TPA: YihY/virulence factor BrkB family protein [Rhizobiales bacterium]|nr:YihY/virulence factor BrkB family protein [Hyphomicrobiales bacterium]
MQENTNKLRHQFQNSKPKAPGISTAKSLVLDIYERFARDDGFPLAGNIAFSSLLATFPFLIFLTALAGFFGDEHLAQTVVDYLLSVAPEDIVKPFARDIHAILTVPDRKVLLVSIAVTLYSAAGGVESIRVGLNRAYGYSETRMWIFRFIQNLVFVIGGAVVLLALAFFIVFGPLWWSRAEGWFPWLSNFSPWFHLLRYPVGLGLMFIALVLGHLFLPVKRHPVGQIMPGILVTMMLWLVAAWTYAEYITRFSRVQVMYAGLGNVVIALIFIYISALVIILGGEINQALIARKEKEEK